MLKHLLFMKRFYVKPPLYLIPLTILVLIAGCGLKQFNSHWLDREIVIDGDRSDWSDALTYLEKMDVSIGFLNNNETFYICLATGNRQLTRQIMARGLVLWFNARGNKSKAFGVKYPLGRMTMGMPRQEEMFPPNEGDMEQQDQHRPFPFEVSQELEILGPEKNDFSRMTRSEILAAGVDMCTDIKNDVFVYELKIPFSYIDQNSAIDALETSETIGIGFTIPEIDIQKLRGEMAERRGEMGGMRPGGSRSGGGMGGPGRRPRGGRGEMGERTAQDNKSLDIWIKVNLAKSQ